MRRRTFLGAMVATAAGLLVPEPERRRVYSFPKRIRVLTPGLYLSLHTADPGVFGADEASYAGYAPMALQRTPQDWRVECGAAENLKRVSFPACVGGIERVTHVSVRDHRGIVLVHQKLRPGDEGIPLHPGAALEFEPGALRISLA